MVFVLHDRCRRPAVLLLALSTTVAITGCPPPPGAERWAVEVGAAFEGSPAYCDLDGDGQREALVPVAPTDLPERSYLQIIDPVTGELGKRSRLGDASFAYPLCVDVDRDGVLDVITGGRIRDVIALSGVEGRRLWTASELHPDVPWANTYSPVTTRSDYFVTTTGGGAPPGGDDRFPGTVLVMGRDGSLLTSWTEPDGTEIYSTAAIVRTGPTTATVAVGSGGETRSGALYLLELDLLTWSITEVAAVPSSCDDGGFIAAPTIGDLDGDGALEVVAAEWCGGVVAASLTGEVKWTAALPHPYPTGNPLLAPLDDSDGFDVVLTSGEFNWSLEETFGDRRSATTALSGTSGATLWENEIEKYLWASPVSHDIDDDGVEDVFVVGADLADDLGTPPPSPLIVYSGADGSELFTYESVSWMGTPLLDDIDGDGELDALLVDAPFTATAFGTGYLPADVKLLPFEGVPFDADASYSGFRGPDHDGVRR